MSIMLVALSLWATGIAKSFNVNHTTIMRIVAAAAVPVTVAPELMRFLDF